MFAFSRLRRMSWGWAIFLAIAAAAAAPVGEATKATARPQLVPQNVVLQRDVEYGRAAGQPLLLNIAWPKHASDPLLPAVIVVHGGGWRAGDKGPGVGGMMAMVASGKYVGLSINYRLTDVACWPAQIHDCKAAVRWLKAHAAKYHVDPQKIGVWGGSAGGHLVALLGTTADIPELEGDNGSPGYSSRVACVVDFCGPTDFLAVADGREHLAGQSSEVVAKLLGGPPAEKRDVAKAASPLTYVSKNAAPILIVHGTEDRTVPPAQAERFYAALKRAGADATFIKIEGGGHSNHSPQILDRVQTFLDHQLRGAAEKVSDAPLHAQPQPQP